MARSRVEDDSDPFRDSEAENGECLTAFVLWYAYLALTQAEGAAKPCIATAIVQKLEESKGGDAQRESQIAQYVTGTAYTGTSAILH